MGSEPATTDVSSKLYTFLWQEKVSFFCFEDQGVRPLKKILGLEAQHSTLSSSTRYLGTPIFTFTTTTPLLSNSGDTHSLCALKCWL